MAISILTPALFAVFLGIACAAFGARFGGGTARARLLVPLSGAVLVSVAVFGLAPELVREAGWVATVALAAAAYFALAWLDRSGHPVCPSCSHGEGFTASLTLATAVHAFVDGWGMVVVNSSSGAAPRAIVAAILVHKIPEGLALGTILRASTGSVSTALTLSAAAELMTAAGGVLGLWAAPAQWVAYPLALAAGSFIFLGLHAIRAEKHRAAGAR